MAVYQQMSCEVAPQTMGGFEAELRIDKPLVFLTIPSGLSCQSRNDHPFAWMVSRVPPLLTVVNDCSPLFTVVYRFPPLLTII